MTQHTGPGSGVKPQSPRPARGRRPRLGELMLLIGGIGIGLSIGLPMLRDEGDVGAWFLVVGGSALGGASLVGVPMLLWERWRGARRRFGPGRLAWFAHGTAAWLLWPPIIFRSADPPGSARGTAVICYYYGTPLMAVYVVASLLAGGWLRGRLRIGRRRRRKALDWRERFGLLLGLAWAVLGLYVLWMIYADKFR